MTEGELLWTPDPAATLLKRRSRVSCGGSATSAAGRSTATKSFARMVGERTWTGSGRRCGTSSTVAVVAAV
jgi:hypothetical protein